MHPSAMVLGEAFFKLYAAPDVRRILDVGARDVNGSLRSFCPVGSAYVGVDLEAGAGVDTVLTDPYAFPFPDNHFDLVVSTSCFEHNQFFWLGFLEQMRVTRPGGFVYINAPSNGAYHGYPFDNWRFYPDAALALQAWALRSGVYAVAIESFIAPQLDSIWSDCVMIFQKSSEPKPPQPLLHEGFPGAYNIRRFDCEHVMNFTPLHEDAKLVNELKWRLALQGMDLPVDGT